MIASSELREAKWRDEVHPAVCVTTSLAKSSRAKIPMLLTTHQGTKKEQEYVPTLSRPKKTPENADSRWNSETVDPAIQIVNQYS